MRSPAFLLLPVLGLALLLTAPGAADEKADAGRIAQLVAQLGSEKYLEREEASRLLEAIGTPALDALCQAARSQDAEIRRRAQALVTKIEKRQTSAELLRPQRLRLQYQDMPIEQAVADLAKKTGFVLKLEGNRAALADVKVTLDTGDTTLWEAFDQFCARAGLVETTPAPAAERAPAKGVVGGSVMIVGGNRPVVPKDITHADNGERPVTLTLTAGKPREAATHHAGALRIQSAAPGAEIAGQKQGGDEILLGLEVMAEPSLRWERVLGLRIEKAIDDQGQTLTQLPSTFTKPAPLAPRNTGTVIINGVPIGPDPPAPEGLKQVPLRLKQGDRPAKALREVSGTLTAMLRSPFEPLVTVDNVLKSAEQTFSGAREASIKMISVKRVEGQVRLVFQVQSPPRKLDDNSLPPRPNMTVMINGKLVGQQDEEPLSGANFTLLDDKGRPFELGQATNTGRMTGAVQELELIFHDDPQRGEPRRLLYNGRRTCIVEVPFRLKDVRLP